MRRESPRNRDPNSRTSRIVAGISSTTTSDSRGLRRNIRTSAPARVSTARARATRPVVSTYWIAPTSPVRRVDRSPAFCPVKNSAGSSSRWANSRRRRRVTVPRASRAETTENRNDPASCTSSSRASHASSGRDAPAAPASAPAPVRPARPPMASTKRPATRGMARLTAVDTSMSSDAIVSAAVWPSSSDRYGRRARNPGPGRPPAPALSVPDGAP